MECKICLKQLERKPDKKQGYHELSDYCKALRKANTKVEHEPSTTPVYTGNSPRKWTGKSLLNTFVYK